MEGLGHIGTCTIIGKNNCTSKTINVKTILTILPKLYYYYYDDNNDDNNDDDDYYYQCC